jgi:phenylpropionate dioxygenase-like ring-hydroxylating dioxygenase large terminal subunit
VSVAEAPPADPPVFRLPPEAYFDPGWYEREQRELFGHTWNLVGHVSELAKPGDFVTATVGAEPVVVLRGAGGELRGFLNVCRHRGMVIACEAAGNCGESLRCGYHGWEFDLEGQLARVPQRKTQFPDIDADRLGLHPVAVGELNGFVFVNPDPDLGESFEQWLGEYPAHSGDYPWAELVEVRRVRVPLACNWKLYVENHIDWLHLWYLHDDSLGQYEHHQATYATTGWHWYSAERMRPGEEPFGAAGLRPIPGVGEHELTTLRATFLFPNVPVSSRGALITTYQVVPTGPESCELDLRYWGAPGSVLTDEALAERLRVQRDEDGLVCERMQLAIHSPRFAVGPLALDHERPIAEFHQNLLSLLA